MSEDVADWNDLRPVTINGVEVDAEYFEWSPVIRLGAEIEPISNIERFEIVSIE